MRLVAISEEANCIRTNLHATYCTGRNHVCYRCGLLFGPCHHSKLGTMLDY